MIRVCHHSAGFVDNTVHVLQVVTWSIDQKTEKALETELARIGASFHFWEERGDDKGTVSVKKWSQPSGKHLI